jgi:cyclophilin family peptidyl-prolyl cis-trans isomerase
MTSLARPLLQRRNAVIVRRTFASGGSRGSRGHGWFQKYRQGLGGRHLQGEYWDAPSEEEWQEWNDSVFAYGSQHVSLTLEIDGNAQHTLELELATAVLPKTTRNFQLLLEDGSYTDSSVYRIEKGVGLCMGDVLGMDGKGGKCHESMALIKGGSTMETEPLVLAHIPGIVTMMAPGIDKVDSRFMLCTHRAPQLDGRHVAFARLSNEESLKLVQHWEESVFTKRGRPTIEMKVVSVSGSTEETETPATA